ncbi:dihydroneopterin aldolase [Thauera sinica]|uniref:dihydroneopterin aldolase n=1 Tax=Thauera sinica TaxID=2665146 RepID=A0ABW1AY68_9RHOO|nr:dihydroneopterin aldolase [Thauera sp. K11]ATE59062.1 dienelactone hydrolase [Thauera sp. K11]
MDFIFIEELRVQAWIGIYAREKAAPQTVELNLTFGVPDAAAIRDDIADTIDYAEVIDRIRLELAQRHFNLIETLGEFVVDLLLNDFRAPWVKVRLAKIGVTKGVRRVGVFIERGRDADSAAAGGAQVPRSCP